MKTQEHATVAPALIPPATFYETNEEIVVLADLPGVGKEMVTVEIDQDALVIEAALKPPGDDLNSTQSELPTSRLRRVFTLASSIDRSAIRAKMKDGVLKLVLPKQAEAQTHQIKVAIA